MKLSSVVAQALAVLLIGCIAPANHLGFGITVARAQEEATEDAVPVPPSDAETYAFEAEVHRMLDIVVNSLYQNKDVFLRELISNASDALDKIRYLMLTKPDEYKQEPPIPLEVKIEYDEDEHTLTIRDTGVGMTHEEMVKNLGTVARSGTSKFIESLKDNKSAISQIGQFGVGFYSAFLVADRVSVASKSPLDLVQHVWESNNGASEFLIYPDPRGNSLERGTEITLHLNEDSLEYVDPDRLTFMARHFSEFVTHPISLRKTSLVTVDVEDEEDEEAGEKKDESEPKEDEDDELEVSEGDDTEEEKPKKTKEIKAYTWERVNGDQAIWTRDKSEISEEEYQAFWQLLAGDDSNATTWSHFDAEGNINFKSILYLPGEIPAEYKFGNLDDVPGAIRLYVKKVLIGDNFKLLPKYLGFIRGVVDSDDLPLNVNRETLQENKVLKVIRKKLIRKAIDMIRLMAKESENYEYPDVDEEEEERGNIYIPRKIERNESKYDTWYREFSANIKLGVMEDEQNRDRLSKLLRFVTSKSKGRLTSLEHYVENMKDWQDEIYVLGCTDVATCKKSPFLEVFKEKDVEVVFLTDAVDEYMMKQIRDFEGIKFKQVSNDNIKFKDEDEDLIKRREKAYKDTFAPLTKWLRKLFHNKSTILRAQVSKRHLGSVPAIVTTSDFGNSANMERILKAQAFQAGMDINTISAMKILEINPRHPLIIKLLETAPPEEADDEAMAQVPQEAVDAAWMLHEVAMLNGGFPVYDPKGHNERVLKYLKSSLGLESFALEPEIDPPIEEDEPPEPGSFDGMNMDDLLDNMNMDDLNLDLDALNLDENLGGDEL